MITLMVKTDALTLVWLLVFTYVIYRSIRSVVNFIRYRDTSALSKIDLVLSIAVIALAVYEAYSNLSVTLSY